MCRANDKRSRQPKPINIVKNVFDNIIKPLPVLPTKDTTGTTTKNNDAYHNVSPPPGFKLKEAVVASTSATTTTTTTTTSSTDSSSWQDDNLDQTMYDGKQVRKEPTLPTVCMEDSDSSLDVSVVVDNQCTTSTTCATVTGRPYTNINDKYYVSPKVLGTGHYGTVRKCIDRVTKERYAIKSIDKCKYGNDDDDCNYMYLQREINILQELSDHPNIIKLIDVCEDEKQIHIVTELCTGGELFDMIIDRNSTSAGHVTEHEAATIIYQMLNALQYCHSKKIAHRDLKPENFLFVSLPSDEKDEGGNKSSSTVLQLKLIDFGLARKHDNPFKPMYSKVGTPYYIAPEVLQRGLGYDKTCDVWSIGTIAYTLLCGYPPFYGDTDDDIFDSILSGYYDFPEEEWSYISYEAKRFVTSLLQKDPNKRMTIKEAMNHRWMKRQLGTQVPTVSMGDCEVDSKVQCLHYEDKVGVFGDVIETFDASGELYIL